MNNRTLFNSDESFQIFPARCKVLDFHHKPEKKNISLFNVKPDNV